MRFEKYLSSVIFSLIFLFVTITTGLGRSDGEIQSDEPLQSRMSVTCVQLADETAQVIGKLRYREDRQYYNIADEEVIFYLASGDENIEIGRGNTDANGEASSFIKTFENIIPDEDSFYTVLAIFEGNEKYSESDSDVLFKRAKVEVKYEIVDSIYKLTINTYQLDQDRTPIGDQDVFIMVPRMFSNLTVANDYSDEEGFMEIDFPKDIPASLDGSLEIIVKIPDTDDFGTLQSHILTDWGVPFHQEAEIASRELWSPDAPLWMLITFVILMGLVWGHFLIIIYKLYLIKKESFILKN